MYDVVYAQGARKALKRLQRSGSFPEDTFRKMLTLFIFGKSIPANFKDHALQGDLAGSRECHLGFNLLVQYEKDDRLRLVTILGVGTHAELFGE